MNPFIIGNPRTMAIESYIECPYEELGLRALGYFVIYVQGHSFGVKEPDASALACSFDEVKNRIERCNSHRVPFSAEQAAAIMEAYITTIYDGPEEGQMFFGFTGDQFKHAIYDNNISWAPDGDEAFDDGSHVLQFDIDKKVRLIAFKQADSQAARLRTMVELYMDADEFYQILNDWLAAFEAELKIFPCPVCGTPASYKDDIFGLCSVCGWTLDYVQQSMPDSMDGVNPLTFTQAKELWQARKRE